MARPQAPMRVVAVRSATDTEVLSFGPGLYVGDEQPPGFPFDNPKINLDDGSVVWGYQCWWGAEEDFETSFIQGRTVTVVPAPDGNGRWQ